MSEDRDVAAFGRRAAGYEGGSLGAWHRRVIERTAELNLSADPAPARVLDVGCGTGALLRLLAERLPETAELIGVDAAGGMVETARSHPGLDRRIRVERGVAEELPVDAAAVDLVVSTTSFDHWADRAAGLAECTRVLEPGGTLVLADLFAAWLRFTERAGRARTRPAVERLLEGAGLRVAGWHAVYRIGTLPLVQAVVARR